MDWFLGATERDVIKQRDKFVDSNGNFRGPEEKLWPPGVFECPTIAALRLRVEQMGSIRPPEEACPLNVVDGIDIGTYQAQFTSDQKAMVQLASNFHCLENGSPSVGADCGRLVSGYASDCTQGPAASFGVPAASLLRAHYAFRKDGVSPSEWGQTSERQVNLIENLCKSKYCGDCKNGKARLLGEELPVTADLIDEVAAQVKVGLHSDCQVVFRRGSKRHTIAVVENPQFVDQVCSATLCYGYANLTHNPPREQLENLTRALLRAAYEGAYLSAIVRQRRILLLTLIGGASFSNPHRLILEELKRAHNMYATHAASSLEEVQLVLYEPGSAKHVAKDLERL
eukprot:TRINITY_DN5666_c0_g3_i1.p1 TRINITY_DN5666_c0_g3~~TRINITY_DN5666_c0_g3_i1.p1  ORF type:complete len:369 (+),score=36.54 TRINITY_DN5666_c0_g3_i1:82-1107(+)